jgi:hypothetical protein
VEPDGLSCHPWQCTRPIGTSILYVSPLYLRAEAGQLPELKRVIAAYEDRVVMANTLPQALAALFKGAPTSASTIAGGTAAVAPAGNAAGEALQDYDAALERLKAGDWGGFGAKLDALRSLLQSLNQQATTH